MRLLICLGLCSALIAGSAVADQPNAEAPVQPLPHGDSDQGPPLRTLPQGDGPLRTLPQGDFDHGVAVVTVPPRSNPQHPVTQPAYPPEAKAAHETGTVVMLLTVDANGYVTEAAIKRSSGFESLDQAAMNEAKSSWQLLPGTVAGKPTAMQYPFAVTFTCNESVCR